MVTTSDIRLRWVLADPARERAVDPLGMAAQADRLADRLLPDLSVQTSRARYLSFLCWAVDQSEGSPTQRASIHRLEAKLALEEARCHRDDSADECPGVVGRSNARRYLEGHAWKEPARPERLYKNTAFATYRPLMRALGLLARDRAGELTPAGERLANAFKQARGRTPRCLSDISSKERAPIRVLLGLDSRKHFRLSNRAERRRSTYEIVRKRLDAGDWSAEILERYRKVGPRPSDVAAVLHQAFAWEVLSLGLTLAFSMLLNELRTGPVVRSLRTALGAHPRRPSLDQLDTDSMGAANVVALLREARRLRPDVLGLDPTPLRIGEILVLKRDPVGFLRSLVDRHRSAKPEDPWIALEGDRVRILAPNKNLAFLVRPRSYRLDAFAQLLRDLGMIR